MHWTMRYTLLTSIAICTPEAIAAGKSDDLKSRADAILAPFEKPGRPGCAVGVFQDGKTLYTGAFGLANLEHNIRIDPQRSVFEIGSVSKQFTAASALLLVLDGKIALDDDIRKYLPEMPNYGHAVTIDHLLHNTSGLRDNGVLRWMRGENGWGYHTEQDTLDLIANQKGLNFIPGSKYTYSNTNFILLGLIVRRVSGQTLEQFAHDRIFAPLGMNQTSFSGALGRVVPNLAYGYSFSGGAFEARNNRWMDYGQRGVRTTISDLAKWQRNFDEPKVGGPRLIELLEENGVLTDGTKIDYARGIEVLGGGAGYRGVRTVAHNGGTWDGFMTTVMRLSDYKLSAAILCNTDIVPPRQIGKMRSDLLDLYMEGKYPAPAAEAAPAPEPEPPVAATETIANLSPNFVGLYWNRDEQLVRRIELVDGKLWYIRSADSRTELAPAGNGKLRMVGLSPRVIVDVSQSPRGRRTLRVAGSSTTIFEKVEPFSPQDLQDYSGVYANAEVGGAGISFVVKDGKLAPVAWFDGNPPLNPSFKDTFDIDGDAYLLFQRNEFGRVTSVVVDNLWARNIVFTRVSGPSK